MLKLVQFKTKIPNSEGFYGCVRNYEFSLDVVERHQEYYNNYKIRTISHQQGLIVDKDDFKILAKIEE